MLRDKSAIASVLLFYVCLFAVLSQSSSQKDWSLDFIHRLRTFKDTVLKQTGINVSLYTPSSQDYQQNCPSATMTCFAEEWKVLITELEIKGMKVSEIPNVGKLEKSLKRKSPSDCSLWCELLEEHSAKIFLDNLLDTVQKIFSGSCKEQKP